MLERTHSRGLIAATALVTLLAASAIAPAQEEAPAEVEELQSAEPQQADPPAQATSGCRRMMGGMGEGPERMRSRDGSGSAKSGCPRRSGRMDGQGCGGCGGRGGVGGQVGQGGHGRQGEAGGHGRNPGGGRGHGRAEMEDIWTLIDNHEMIERRIENIAGGVRTVTTTTDPGLVPVLQRHAAQMADLIENGGRIRMWDPLFVELLSHSEKITMEVVDTETGVTVTETSEDEKVASLIRAHAKKVLEFVERGAEAYFEETPLPSGYGE